MCEVLIRYIIGGPICPTHEKRWPETGRTFDMRRYGSRMDFGRCWQERDGSLMNVSRFELHQRCVCACWGCKMRWKSETDPGHHVLRHLWMGFSKPTPGHRLTFSSHPLLRPWMRVSLAILDDGKHFHSTEAWSLRSCKEDQAVVHPLGGNA
jgi:hypothetical protein